MDNSGAGYSSFYCLNHLPFYLIFKIGKVFVDDFSSDYKAEEQVQNIIDVGHRLRLWAGLLFR